MDYEKAFIELTDALTAKLNAERLAYDLFCRKKGSASYDAAKALGVMRGTQEALEALTSAVCLAAA